MDDKEKEIRRLLAEEDTLFEPDEVEHLLAVIDELRRALGVEP